MRKAPVVEDDHRERKAEADRTQDEEHVHGFLTLLLLPLSFKVLSIGVEEFHPGLRLVLLTPALDKREEAFIGICAWVIGRYASLACARL